MRWSKALLFAALWEAVLLPDVACGDHVWKHAKYCGKM